MKIVIEIEEDDLNIGVYIEDVEKPNQTQAKALLELAKGAGILKPMLFEEN